MDGDVIDLSPLAQRALAGLNSRYQEQQAEILQMDAEAQEIDTEAYGFDGRQGAWVPREAEEEPDEA